MKWFSYERTSTKARNHSAKISDRGEDSAVVCLIEIVRFWIEVKPVQGNVHKRVEATNTVP